MKKKKKEEFVMSVSEQRRHLALDVQYAYEQILRSMQRYCSLDGTDPNFTETPQRVGRSFLELFDGMFDTEKKVQEILSKTFPADVDEMITVGPVVIWSICAHHFLPFKMKVWVSYVPDKKVLGLSKIARLAELISQKPCLQENFTKEVAQTIQKVLAPKGVGVLARGRHLCTEIRGLKKESPLTTTALQGVFRQPSPKAEFLAAVRGK